MALDAFTRHPASVGESYTEHFGTALSFAVPLFIAACCCFLHAAFPFLFEKTGSRIVTRLHDRMVAHRVKPQNRARIVTDTPQLEYVI